MTIARDSFAKFPINTTVGYILAYRSVETDSIIGEEGEVYPEDFSGNANENKRAKCFRFLPPPFPIESHLSSRNSFQVDN